MTTTITASQIDVATQKILTGGGFDSAFWPRWSVHKNGTTQDDLGSSDELVTWSTAVFDEGASIDLASTYDFTVPAGASGIYLICSSLRWKDMADTNECRVSIYVDAVIKSQVGIRSPGTARYNTSISQILKLTALEKVDIRGSNSSITTSDVIGTAAETWWTGCRIA